MEALLFSGAVVAKAEHGSQIFVAAVMTKFRRTEAANLVIMEGRYLVRKELHLLLFQERWEPEAAWFGQSPTEVQVLLIHLIVDDQVL